jgi:rhodanese-related sulfurtransferase
MFSIDVIYNTFANPIFRRGLAASIRRTFLTVFLPLLFVACDAAVPTIVELPSHEARNIIELPHGPGFQLIDARSPEMFTTGHIVNAIQIDAYAADVAERVTPLLQKDTLFLYCTTNKRIQVIREILTGQGFTGALFIMTDGITGWKENNFALETP